MELTGCINKINNKETANPTVRSGDREKPGETW